jgi:hypothetical protein
MTLSNKHLEDICLLNSSDASKVCRYLRNDEFNQNNWYCQKLQPKVKSKIDSSLVVIRKGKRREIPAGDNCHGYPLLKHIKQGYDQT